MTLEHKWLVSGTSENAETWGGTTPQFRPAACKKIVRGPTWGCKSRMIVGRKSDLRSNDLCAGEKMRAGARGKSSQGTRREREKSVWRHHSSNEARLWKNAEAGNGAKMERCRFTFATRCVWSLIQIMAKWRSWNFHPICEMFLRCSLNSAFAENAARNEPSSVNVPTVLMMMMIMKGTWFLFYFFLSRNSIPFPRCCQFSNSILIKFEKDVYSPAVKLCCTAMSICD